MSHLLRVFAGAYPTLVMCVLVWYKFLPILAMVMMHLGMLILIAAKSIEDLKLVFTPRFKLVHIVFLCLTSVLGVLIFYFVAKPLFKSELISFKNLMRAHHWSLLILVGVFLVTLNPLIEEAFWRKYLLQTEEKNEPEAASTEDGSSLLAAPEKHKTCRNYPVLLNSAVWYTLYHSVIFLSRLSYGFAVVGSIALVILGCCLSELTRFENDCVGGAVAIHAAVDLVMVISLILIYQ